MTITISSPSYWRVNLHYTFIISVLSSAFIQFFTLLLFITLFIRKLEKRLQAYNLIKIAVGPSYKIEITFDLGYYT